MEHPWKHASYLNYLAKQKHLNSGANVYQFLRHFQICLTQNFFELDASSF